MNRVRSYGKSLVGVYIILFFLLLSCQTTQRDSATDIPDMFGRYVFPHSSDGKFAIFGDQLGRESLAVSFHWTSGSGVEYKSYFVNEEGSSLASVMLWDCNYQQEQIVRQTENYLDDGRSKPYGNLRYEYKTGSRGVQKYRVFFTSDVTEAYTVDCEIRRTLGFEGIDNGILVIKDELSSSLVSGSSVGQFDPHIIVSKYQRDFGLIWRGFYDQSMTIVSEQKFKRFLDHL